MKHQFAALALLLLAQTVGAQTKDAAAPVVITETSEVFVLDNGTLQATVAKASGDLVSLRYKSAELLATFLTPEGQPDLAKDPPGQNLNGLNRGMTDHQYGFWSHDAMGLRGSTPAVAAITIDPKANGGDRGEVSVKGVSNGRPMGTGPGNAGGNFIADIEIRYALGRGDSGVYTYCVFEHQPAYPATAIGEARFCAKLADFFDWMTVGPKYDRLYPKSQERGEDKYTYTTNQTDNPVFGWASTTRNVGLYLINPSMEYMSGGPTKMEFLGHRDTNAVSAPCILNYWRSSHYGGASVAVAAGEHWSKVVGPFLLYATDGADPKAMYGKALKQHQAESAAWPYAWVAGVDYPHKDQRATVTGKLVLNDPGHSGAPMTNLRVGLTAPAYSEPQATTAPSTGLARRIDWQLDAKNYEFWTKGSPDGSFSIANVRPGTYTLHAFADGILGEFAKAEITIPAGKPTDLGELKWTPVRKGRQLWEIGVPNRNASEFFRADDYATLDIPLQYATLFPNDVVYTIGQSDFRKDWFFQHVPHNVDPDAKAQPFRGVVGKPGNAAPRTIRFSLPAAPADGTATLRLAICGTGTRTLVLSVNDQPAGAPIVLPTGDGVITRHQIQGIWYEKEISFPANLLKAGENTLTLTVPAGPVNNGVLYDYLRLELGE